jgi:hypothetical protein
MNRKELEAHLRDGRAKLAEQRHKRQSDRDKVRAENDTRVRELRAEVARLRAALRLMDEFAWTAVTADCEEARIGLNERLAAVRAALEPKP